MSSIHDQVRRKVMVHCLRKLRDMDEESMCIPLTYLSLVRTAAIRAKDAKLQNNNNTNNTPTTKAASAATASNSFDTSTGESDTRTPTPTETTAPCTFTNPNITLLPTSSTAASHSQAATAGFFSYSNENSNASQPSSSKDSRSLKASALGAELRRMADAVFGLQLSVLHLNDLCILGHILGIKRSTDYMVDGIAELEEAEKELAAATPPLRANAAAGESVSIDQVMVGTREKATSAVTAATSAGAAKKRRRPLSKNVMVAELDDYHRATEPQQKRERRSALLTEIAVPISLAPKKRPSGGSSALTSPAPLAGTSTAASTTLLANAPSVPSVLSPSKSKEELKKEKDEARKADKEKKKADKEVARKLTEEAKVLAKSGNKSGLKEPAQRVFSTGDQLTLEKKVRVEASSKETKKTAAKGTAASRMKKSASEKTDSVAGSTPFKMPSPPTAPPTQQQQGPSLLAVLGLTGNGIVSSKPPATTFNFGDDDGNEGADELEEYEEVEEIVEEVEEDDAKCLDSDAENDNANDAILTAANSNAASPRSSTSKPADSARRPTDASCQQLASPRVAPSVSSLEPVLNVVSGNNFTTISSSAPKPALYDFIAANDNQKDAADYLLKQVALHGTLSATKGAELLIQKGVPFIPIDPATGVSVEGASAEPQASKSIAERFVNSVFRLYHKQEKLAYDHGVAYIY